MIFEPYILQSSQIVTFKILKSLNAFAIKVILHHIIQYFTVFISISIDKFSDQKIESFIWHLIQHQITLTVLKYFQLPLQMNIHHQLPTYTILITQFHELQILQNIFTIPRLIDYSLFVIFNLQINNYRIQLWQVRYRLRL